MYVIHIDIVVVVIIVVVIVILVVAAVFVALVSSVNRCCKCAKTSLQIRFHYLSDWYERTGELTDTSTWVMVDIYIYVYWQQEADK